MLASMSRLINMLEVALTYQGLAIHFRQREERVLMSHAMRRVVRYGSANTYGFYF